MGFLVLGAAAIAICVLGFFLVVARQVWRDFREKSHGRTFWDYVSLGIVLSIPVVLLYPAFPGMLIAVLQCKARGGEKFAQHIRSDSYVLAAGDSHAVLYNMERLAHDLLERKFAYVEVLGIAQRSLYSDLHKAPSGEAARNRSARKSSLPSGLRFFVSEAGAENCISNSVNERTAIRYRSIQQRLGLPNSLCIAVEEIEVTAARYSVTYVVEQEFFPAPIMWKGFLLKRVSDDRQMAEDKGFLYQPYGPGMISALVGVFAGQSFYAEGLRCQVDASHGRLFPQSLHSAPETYLADERIRASSELVKFYGLQ